MRKQRVIGLGQARRFFRAVGKVEDFIGTIDSRDLRGDGVIFAERISSDHEAAANRARDLSAADGNAAKILRAVVFGGEVDVLAVIRKTQVVNVAIKSTRKDMGLPAC